MIYKNQATIFRQTFIYLLVIYTPICISIQDIQDSLFLDQEQGDLIQLGIRILKYIYTPLSRIYRTPYSWIKSRGILCSQGSGSSNIYKYTFIQDIQDSLFLDQEQGGYYATRDQDPQIVLRLKDDHVRFKGLFLFGL